MSGNHDPFAPGGGAQPPNDGPTVEQGTSAPAHQPEPVAAPVSESATAQGGDGVPAGTTKEVLDWVGDDKSRAQAALDAEQASSEPRKGLTRELEELLG